MPKIHETRAFNAINWYIPSKQVTFPDLYKNKRKCRIDYRIKYRGIVIEVDEKHHFIKSNSDQTERDKKVCNYFMKCNIVLIRLHYQNSEIFYKYLDQLISIVSSNMNTFRGKVIIDSNHYYGMLSYWDMNVKDVIHINDIFKRGSGLVAIDPRGNDGDILMTDIIRI